MLTNVKNKALCLTLHTKTILVQNYEILSWHAVKQNNTEGTIVLQDGQVFESLWHGAKRTCNISLKVTYKL